MDTRLWIAEDPLQIFGIDLGRRMTVTALPRTEAWLGKVRYIVAPARFHDLHLDRTLAAFPLTELYAIPSIFGRHSSRPGTFPLPDRAI